MMTISWNWEKIEQLVRVHFGLLLDVDGTLGPLTPNPDDMRIDRDVRAALLDLMQQRVPVGINTGRSVTDVMPKVNLPGIKIFGNHGAERSTPWLDVQYQLVPSARRFVESSSTLLNLADQIPNIRVEHKSVGGTLHYETATDPSAIHRHIVEVLEGPVTQAGMRLVQGTGLTELLLPPTVASKADATFEFVTQYELQGLLIAGDSMGDLPTFDEAHWLQEMGVRTCIVLVRHGREPSEELLQHANIIVDGIPGMARLLLAIAGQMPI